MSSVVLREISLKRPFGMAATLYDYTRIFVYSTVRASTSSLVIIDGSSGLLIFGNMHNMSGIDDCNYFSRYLIIYLEDLLTR